MVVEYTVSLMTVACIIHSHSPLPVVGGTTQRCVRGRVTEAIMTVVWCNEKWFGAHYSCSYTTIYVTST